MGLPGIGTPVRAGGKDASVWRLEWTAAGATGEVTLDEDQSDLDPRVATPVADSGTTGVTNITFPKCDRLWLLSKGCEPATEGTASNYRHVELCNVDTDAGTAELRFLAADGGALADPESGSRMRLVLLLEYP